MKPTVKVLQSLSFDDRILALREFTDEQLSALANKLGRKKDQLEDAIADLTNSLDFIFEEMDDRRKFRNRTR